jgi:hypothetical protein
MKAINKLDSFFGPAGVTAGIVLVIAGLIMTWYSISAVLLILIGAFTGFSYTGTLIDFDHKRLKYSNFLFGFIRTGKWQVLEPGMKLGIERSGKAYRTYSRSNRILDVEKKDYRIFLFDDADKKIIPLMKASSIQSATDHLRILSDRLGLKILG